MMTLSGKVLSRPTTPVDDADKSGVPLLRVRSSIAESNRRRRRFFAKRFFFVPLLFLLAACAAEAAPSSASAVATPPSNLVAASSTKRESAPGSANQREKRSDAEIESAMIPAPEEAASAASAASAAALAVAAVNLLLATGSDEFTASNGAAYEPLDDNAAPPPPLETGSGQSAWQQLPQLPPLQPRPTQWSKRRPSWKRDAPSFLPTKYHHHFHSRWEQRQKDRAQQAMAGAPQAQQALPHPAEDDVFDRLRRRFQNQFYRRLAGRPFLNDDYDDEYNRPPVFVSRRQQATVFARADFCRLTCNYCKESSAVPYPVARLCQSQCLEGRGRSYNTCMAVYNQRARLQQGTTVSG